MIGRVFKAHGVILKRKNTGEADRIITLFTQEHGKIRVMAKGIRKVSSKRAPHLEVFTEVTCVIHKGKTLDIVSEVVPLRAFSSLRSDLSRISVAYYFCELIDSLLPEAQEHVEVFDLFVSSLNQLEESSTNIYRLSRDVTLNLLWMLGFLPPQKELSGKELQAFIESITERKLKSTHFARLLLDREKS